jgi:hypothetical protein
VAAISECFEYKLWVNHWGSDPQSPNPLHFIA